MSRWGFRKVLARNKGSGFASKRVSLLTLVKWLSIQHGNKKCQSQKKSTFQPCMSIVHSSCCCWMRHSVEPRRPLYSSPSVWTQSAALLWHMLPPLLCPGASPSREAFWATQGSNPSILTPFLPYCLYNSTVIVSLVSLWANTPTKGNLEEKGSLWLTTIGYSPSWQRGQGGRNLIASHITSAIHSREGWIRACSLHRSISLLFHIRDPDPRNDAIKNSSTTTTPITTGHA